MNKKYVNVESRKEKKGTTYCDYILTDVTENVLIINCFYTCTLSALRSVYTFPRKEHSWH